MKTLRWRVASILALCAVSQSAWAGGTIAGSVLYRGEQVIPIKRPVTVDAAVCGAESIDESLVLGKRGALKNAVIFLQGRVEGSPVFPSPDGGFKIDQKECRFEPHVTIAASGSSIVILNTDHLNHSLKSLSRTNIPQEVAQPKSVGQVRLSFSYPEIIELRCGIHDWKKAWIVVAEHPYYALTNENGRFQIQDVPAGDYTLALWHEYFGLETRRIQVREGEHLQVDWSPKSPNTYATPREPWISRTAARLDVNVLPIQFVQWP